MGRFNGGDVMKPWVVEKMRSDTVIIIVDVVMPLVLPLVVEDMEALVNMIGRYSITDVREKSFVFLFIGNVMIVRKE